MKNILLLLTTSILLFACQQSKVADTNNVDELDASAQTIEAKVIQKDPLKTPVLEQEAQVELVETPIAVAVKAGNGLNFEHRLSSERAKIGVPYDIELDFLGTANDSFTAEFVATPGLSLTSTANANIQMNKSGRSATQTITLLPQQEGIHFVTIYKAGVNQQQKPTAIKVIVGDKDIKEYLQTPGTIVEQEDGSKVISMKADEG